MSEQVIPQSEWCVQVIETVEQLSPVATGGFYEHNLILAKWWSFLEKVAKVVLPKVHVRLPTSARLLNTPPALQVPMGDKPRNTMSKTPGAMESRVGGHRSLEAIAISNSKEGCSCQ